MNRLQKKCFIASAGLHLLLVLILVVGPAFLSSKNKTDEMPTIDFVPSKLIDAAFSGGGNPNTRPPPPAPPAPVVPQPREVAPPEQKPEPKPEPVKPVKPAVESLEARKEPARPKPEITTTAVSRNADSQKKAKQSSETDSHAKAEADARQKKKLAALIGETANNLRSEVSSSTKIDTNPGPGGGGEAYAGYEMALQRIYKGRYDEALGVAGDVGDAHASVRVSVTIKRDGTVLSSRIIGPSGISSLDRLVKGVLDRVNLVRPFPETSKDSQRTFDILFECKPKQSTG